MPSVATMVWKPYTVASPRPAQEWSIRPSVSGANSITSPQKKSPAVSEACHAHALLLQVQREAEVQRILGRLDEREQEIIVRRFGLRRGQEPLTLKQVGVELGVTKERIRQIETRALSKLRQAADEEKIDVGR